MSVSRTFYFAPKVFAAGQVSTGLSRVLSRVFSEGSETDVTLFRTLSDGTKQNLHRQSLEALRPVCDLAHERVSILVDFGERSEYTGMIHRGLRSLLDADEEGFLSLLVEAEEPEVMREFVTALKEELALDVADDPKARATSQYEAGRNPVPSLMQVVDELSDRLGALERQRGDGRSRLTCFLSFQFGGASIDYARQVRRFLELLDVRVITGEGYEPKPINEKVRDRLREAIDFVVLIEVRERKSSWTRDEIARAQQPGVFLIPLVEIGATFDSGIFGDHEYIQFAEGHIGDGFIGLAEGVEYVRRLARTAVGTGDALGA